MSGFWKSYDELKKSCQNKKVIFWGRSEDWTAKTLSKMSGIKVDYIIDRSESYEGSKFLGFDVFTPSKLKEENLESIFIVITASAYKSIELSISF